MCGSSPHAEPCRSHRLADPMVCIHARGAINQIVPVCGVGAIWDIPALAVAGGDPFRMRAIMGNRVAQWKRTQLLSGSPDGITDRG
jgi:hypothetical protein